MKRTVMILLMAALVLAAVLAGCDISSAAKQPGEETTGQLIEVNPIENTTEGTTEPQAEPHKEVIEPVISLSQEQPEDWAGYIVRSHPREEEFEDGISYQILHVIIPSTYGTDDKNPHSDILLKAAVECYSNGTLLWRAVYPGYIPGSYEKHGIDSSSGTDGLYWCGLSRNQGITRIYERVRVLDNTIKGGYYTADMVTYIDDGGKVVFHKVLGIYDYLLQMTLFEDASAEFIVHGVNDNQNRECRIIRYDSKGQEVGISSFEVGEEDLVPLEALRMDDCYQITVQNRSLLTTPNGKEVRFYDFEGNRMERSADTTESQQIEPEPQKKQVVYSNQVLQIPPVSENDVQTEIYEGKTYIVDDRFFRFTDYIIDTEINKLHVGMTYSEFESEMTRYSYSKVFSVVGQPGYPDQFLAYFVNGKETGHVYELYASWDGSTMRLTDIVDTGIPVDFIAPYESLELIQNGMQLEEMVSILGMPYYANSGNYYSYFWRIGDFNHVVEIFVDIPAGDPSLEPATVYEVQYLN